MKNFAFVIIALLSFVSVSAQDLANGYYRVWNFMTERYVYIIDDKGSINMSTTDADLNAIWLWKNLDKAVSDPATVLYFKHISGRQYDIQAQGTGIAKILENNYVNIRAVSDKEAPNTYLAYGSNNVATKYLADGEKKTRYEEGIMSTNVTNPADKAYRYWYITPISENTEQFFGIKPTIQNGGKHYAAFFADFPIAAKSTGTKMFYITKIADGMAVKEEVPAGAVVPRSTPIIIECSSAYPTDNRLIIGGNPSASVANNRLRGVMFNNATADWHNNQVRYDAQSMRVLGTMTDGSLGFVKSTEAFIAANSSYLLLPQNGSTYPDQIKIVTQDEYDTATSGVDEITVNGGTATKDVYTCQGILLQHNASQKYINSLSPGLYIIGNKKILIK